MTIEKALKYMKSVDSAKIILSDFEAWLEEEIVKNILNNKEDLATFSLTQKSLFTYGEHKKHICDDPAIKTFFISCLSIYVSFLCEKYDFKFHGFDTQSLSEWNSTGIIKYH